MTFVFCMVGLFIYWFYYAAAGSDTGASHLSSCALMLLLLNIQFEYDLKERLVSLDAAHSNMFAT